MTATALKVETDIVILPELEAHIPAHRQDEFAQLERNILDEGCREPLILWSGGNVLVDGHNRYRICSKHGIPFETSFMEFADIESVKEWMEDNQLGRRNLTPENFSYYLGRKYKRRKKPQGGDHKSKDQIDPLINAAESIATEHGVSAPTVKRAEKFANAIDKIEELLGSETKQIILSGEIDASRATIEAAADIIAAAAEGGRSISIDVAINSAKRSEVFGEIASRTPANDNKLPDYRTSFTGENEWYTPAEHIDAARKVMGSIDVDPASSKVAQRVVKAAKFYTKADNSLDKEWHGRVWLNPPYSQPEIVHFIDKLVEEYTSGRCTEAILLTHNSTDTKWFNTLFKNASAICWTTGRVKFYSPDGKIAAAAMGQAFTYFGPKPDFFEEVFSNVGNVWGPKWRKTAA